MIELAVVLAITGILAAIALPNLAGTMRSNRIRATGAELQGDIAFARMEGARRRANVYVCALNALPTAATSSYTCQSLASDWSIGWVVSSTAPASGVIPASSVLRVRSNIINMAISATGSIATSSALSLNQLGGANQTGSFTVCNSNSSGEPGVALSLQASGLLDSSPTTC